MVRLILLIPFMIMTGTSVVHAQSTFPEDTRTVESTIQALYAVISGEPGVPRDWQRFKNLFGPEARLIPTRKDKTGEFYYEAISPDQYIQLFTSRIATGFYERELSNRTESYGTITHVFSTYETRDTQAGPVTNRGINSIQLFKANNRYYIVTIFWCAESMGFELPQRYLSKP